MTQIRYTPRRVSHLSSLLTTLALALTACQPPPSTPTHAASAPTSANQAMPSPKSASGTAPVQLTGYNHTTDGIYSYSVDDVWGGSLYVGGGGGFTCCVRLPKVWAPGIKVEVKWEPHRDTREVRTLQVEVPEYNSTTMSRLSVHFLRGGDVKVFATRMAHDHPDYPFKGPESYLKEGVPTVSPY
jgi:Protein of unknown function (DUF3304)